MKKGQVVFGFKKYGNFILDQEVKSLEDFAWEMQYGKFICYNKEIQPTSVILDYSYSTIIEGIENGLFWTCSMENIQESLTFWDKHFVKIVVGIILIALTIAFAVRL